MLDEIISMFWKIFRVAKKFIFFVIVIGALIFFLGAGTYMDRQKNVRILKSELPATISAQARTLHEDLVIADWHSDNLLWDRNPLNRLNRGHVDVPRLVEGNFTLQVFDAVIKVPRGVNYESNSGNTDIIRTLAMANRWPIGTWFSLTKRALHQSDILHEAAEKSSSLTLIKTKSDLDIFAKLRRSNTMKVAGVLSVEGLHALGGKLENVDVLYDAGFRIMGLVHFLTTTWAAPRQGSRRVG